MKAKDRSNKYQRIRSLRRREGISNLRSRNFRFRDFSMVEDDAEAFKLIRKMASDAGTFAAAEAKARGIETAYIRDNKLVKVFAEGKTVDLVPKSRRTLFYVKYNPSIILYAIAR